eukprot:CAMPEP_0181028204 /NCGR_PEP_ID=MMETSP1070-20121207/4549_1 /TAXON_ID=265543 /ORGANISM="Minutocellus polymorphus, Strain NH13" /LENGTH=260 /DNA_ID=CAMNT_0023105449 /DNA_START=66 /DNA_END=848 /DNA_ORIENTATION=+
MRLLFILAVLTAIHVSAAESRIRVTFDKYRRGFDSRTKLAKIEHGRAEDFSFGRFQSPDSIEEAMNKCRKPSSFRHYTNGLREGLYCSTKLGGDWVLAESKQIAKRCTPEEVLQAYLDGDNQKKNNPDKVKQCTIARTRPGIYAQKMVLLPQRVLSGMTTEMRYTQKIRVDKIGNYGFNAFVELDAASKTTTKLKPFDILKVNVSLKQVGDDVHIYACGLMRVNRKVVPNLYIFDASGIAGAMAGKGTLWLSSHFANRLK